MVKRILKFVYEREKRGIVNFLPEGGVGWGGVGWGGVGWGGVGWGGVGWGGVGWGGVGWGIFSGTTSTMLTHLH